MFLKTDVPVEEFFTTEEGILEEHWEEVAGNKHAIKLDPDIKKYKLLQELGIIKNFVLYNDDEMMGYAVLIVQPHLHYQQDVFGHVDVIFVKKKYRNTRAGLLLINAVDSFAEDNVAVITYHTKPTHPTIEKIIEKRGYKHMENIFGKVFKKEL